MMWNKKNPKSWRETIKEALKLFFTYQFGKFLFHCIVFMLIIIPSMLIGIVINVSLNK